MKMYFEPIDLSGYEYADKPNRKRLGDVVRAYHSIDHFPDYENMDIAIIGVNEDRGALNNKGCDAAPSYVREYLYRLFEGDFKARIVDLGNIKAGENIRDTYFALTDVMQELISMHIVPVVIGGSQDLTFAAYKAYEKLNNIINIVAVDPMFDLGEKEGELNSTSYLSKIILNQPNFLFNYTNLGYQTYFVDDDAISLMEQLFFDIYRLGVVRSDLTESEPVIRNADLLTFDVSAIRQSDAPANANASPNGFYGEEACQLMRYAGMSDKLSALGLFEMNPKYDNNGQTAHLMAQMIWYFIDGFYHRFHEVPHEDTKNYFKYTVTIKDHKEDLVFYKSKKSDRWWMKVPVRSNLKVKFERHYFVPCSYSDYQFALTNEIPDRWWQAYQKLM